MKIVLSKDEKERLESQHRVERDRRVADRIKAVLAVSEGYNIIQISNILRLHPDTVREHLHEYEESKKLQPENGGSEEQLTVEQAEKLIAHLAVHTYANVAAICAYVKEEYGIDYAVSGMTQWLHRHKFSYKKLTGVPSKADAAKQEAFKKEYEELKKNTPANEPILFGDGVHPTMATKLGYGWIRTGTDKAIATTASRTRVNLFGALNLENMSLVTRIYDTINSESMAQFFADLRSSYPTAPKIHFILDQGPYNTSERTKEAAKEHDIILHFLPTYSPNLNPIERCWKVMNERVRNNHYFQKAAEFRKEIENFFNVTWDVIAPSLVDRINDNFQSLPQRS